MNERMINFYMTLAKECAKMSRARRLQVGAILVKNNNIISFSWNGTPSNWDNNCEDTYWMDISSNYLSPEEIKNQWPHEGTYLDNEGNVVSGRYKLVTKPEVLHAEMNNLMKLAKSTASGENATMFVTHSPCLECAKGIYQAGIKEVFYENQYRSNDGIEFLKKCRIAVTQISVDEKGKGM